MYKIILILDKFFLKCEVGHGGRGGVGVQIDPPSEKATLKKSSLNSSSLNPGLTHFLKNMWRSAHHFEKFHSLFQIKCFHLYSRVLNCFIGLDLNLECASFKSLNFSAAPTNINPCTQEVYFLITKFDNFSVSSFPNIRGKVLNQSLWKVENWTN